MEKKEKKILCKRKKLYFCSPKSRDLHGKQERVSI